MIGAGIFLFDDVELLDFAGPYEVFSAAGDLNEGNSLFEVFTITGDGNGIRTINGLRVVPDYSFINHPRIDILIVPGGIGTKAEMEKENVLVWLLQNYIISKYTLSICSGARLLAKLGLLDNIEAVTHHEVVSDIREISPSAVISNDKRYIDSGKLLTSAGITAGMDLSFYMLEKLCGEEVKNDVMAYMEYGNWKIPGKVL